MLKTFIVILVCLILQLQPINNLLIIFSYVINKEFIATVLCINREIPDNDCQGSCQVAEQLKEQEKKKKEQSGIMSQKTDITLCLPVSSAYLFPPAHDQNYPALYMNKKLSTAPSSIFHPPRQRTA
jgi:hypothetical protein